MGHFMDFVQRKRSHTTYNIFNSKTVIQNTPCFVSYGTIVRGYMSTSGPGSSVGIAGRSGDRIPVGGDFPHLFRLVLGPTQHPVHNYGYHVFLGGIKWPGREADPSPLSSAE
jgi:hypothetical protein